MAIYTSVFSLFLYYLLSFNVFMQEMERLFSLFGINN